MERWLVMVPVLLGWAMMLRLLEVDQAVLDLDTYVSEVVRDWWRRWTFTGRHSRSWVRRVAGEQRRREEAALDRVWATGLAEWADRARGHGLDRGRVAAWT